MLFQLSAQVWLYDELGPSPPAPPALALPIRASTAFGDGRHPTTRLCAGAVDFLCRLNRIERFLDVGTGTGVLARIARARGAMFSVGTDIDPVALAAARTNGALDSELSGELVVTHASPAHWGATFDLVIANILEAPLYELAPELRSALAPRGTLLISGFTRPQSPSLRLHFEKQALVYKSEAVLEGWVLLRFELGERG